MPCIYPLAEKNYQYSAREGLKILAPLFETSKVDPERPIIAAVSRYDVHKNQRTILRAFKRLREERNYPVPPYLIFLGNVPTDDVGGDVSVALLRQEAGDDPDVHFWLNVPDNDRVVGALMRIARAFVHVSTREGFGLVVSEALWQGTPVIGSKVGGITRQVLDGRTGYLVDPLDVDAIAAKLARLLDRPDEAAALGAQGREHVREHFLLPELLRRHLVLLRYYRGVDRGLPEFRLNDLSYSERVQALRPWYAGLAY